MRTSSKFLISIVIILIASACSSEKKQQKAIVKQPSLEKAIIGSWTTEGSAEQIDDYIMAGYGQQIIFNNDKTFEMGVMMSISGTMPYETAALPVSATSSFVKMDTSSFVALQTEPAPSSVIM